MRDDPGNHGLCRRAESGSAIVHLVLTVTVDHREVNVETTAPFVVPRLAHERRVDSSAMCDVLHRSLENERPICGIERIGMPQVDLVLGR